VYFGIDVFFLPILGSGKRQGAAGRQQEKPLMYPRQRKAIPLSDFSQALTGLRNQRRAICSALAFVARESACEISVYPGALDCKRQNINSWPVSTGQISQNNNWRAFYARAD
jgi:hypothetical protein